MKFWSLELVKERELNKQVQLEATIECQVYDAEGEKQLSFTESPSLPGHFEKVERVPLSAGMYNLVRQMLP